MGPMADEPLVLVIDDETGSRESMAIALEKAGLKVRTFDDAKRALEYLDTDPGAGLAVSDLKMPGMGGIEFLRAVRERSAAVLVCKRGPLGCVIFDGAIPDSVDDGLVCGGFSVPVLNTLGAGDAFMSGFLRGHLTGEDLATAARWGNACGALVVSRPACAPALRCPAGLMRPPRKAWWRSPKILCSGHT